MIRIKHKNYRLTAALTLLFIADCVTGGMVKSNPFTWEEAYYAARQFVMWREVFLWLMDVAMFGLVIAGISGLLRFDKWDAAVMATILLAQSITVFDYMANGNGRSVDIDYWAFGTVLLLIWILKIFDVELIWNRLWNSRKTRH